MSCTFDEDAYRNQLTNKYLDEQDEDTESQEEAYNRYMDELADRADARRELERERDYED